MQDSSSVCISFAFKENCEPSHTSELRSFYGLEIKSQKLGKKCCVPISSPATSRGSAMGTTAPSATRGDCVTPRFLHRDVPKQTDCSRFCFLSTSTEKASSRRSTSSSCSTLLCCAFLSAPACAPAASQLSTNTHTASGLLPRDAAGAVLGERWL